MDIVLNVAQRPSVAKNISQLLTEHYSFKKSQSQSNPIYQFQLTLNGLGNQHYFTSVNGRLTDLKYKQKYKYWDKQDPMFILKEGEIHSFVLEDNINIHNNLKDLAKQCIKLILWTDCTGEGENIAFQIIDVCKKENPNLQILRARYSAITHEEIMKALQNLNRPNEILSDSVNARREIDLRIGTSFTIFQTNSLSRFSKQSYISYGPCQTPTLGFVVQRHQEIEEFIQKPFWYIQLKVGDVEFEWEKGQMFDKSITSKLFERCFDEFGQVIEVKQLNTEKLKPVPLSMIEFQKLGSEKLRKSPDEVMKTALYLYGQGFISHPRTKTNQFPEYMDMQKCLKILQSHSKLGLYIKNLLNGQYETPRMGPLNDGFYPPIYPVKVMEPMDGSQEEYEVYDLILRHFLANCSKNARGQENSVKIQVNQEKFSKTGNTIIEKNYLEVYIFDKWTEFQIPQLEREQKVKIQLELKQASTQPPNSITESELITLMESNGIGTDTTIHMHIKAIQDNLYATKQQQVIRPTKLGIAIIKGYKSVGLKLHEPYQRQLIENKINQVALGKANKKDIIYEIIQEMAEILKVLQDDSQKFTEAVREELNKQEKIYEIRHEKRLGQPDINFCDKQPKQEEIQQQYQLNYKQNQYQNQQQNQYSQYYDHQQQQNHQQNNQQNQQQQQAYNGQNIFYNKTFEQKELFKSAQKPQVQCYKCKTYGHYANTCNQNIKDRKESQ